MEEDRTDVLFNPEQYFDSETDSEDDRHDVEGADDGEEGCSDNDNGDNVEESDESPPSKTRKPRTKKPSKKAVHALEVDDVRREAESVAHGVLQTASAASGIEKNMDTLDIEPSVTNSRQSIRGRRRL